MSSEKLLELLLKDAEKQAKKGKTKEAITTLKSSLEHKRLPSTLLRLSELHLDLFHKVAAFETLQQAAEYSLLVLRSLPSANDATIAEELLKRAGGPARAKAEASLDAVTKQGLAKRAGAETSAQLDQLVQIKVAPPAAAAPPPAATQPPRSAAALADECFGYAVAATTGGMASLTHKPPPASQLLALPAPRGGAAAGASAAELRTRALDSMRAIAARLDALAAADRADEVKSIADALQRVEEQAR